MKPLLQLCKVRKRYGQLLALWDVDIELAPGSLLGVIGRSGSGKSTLGRIAMGLENPDAGEVLFEGKALCSLSKEEKKAFHKNVQIVFQNPFSTLNPYKKVRDLLAEPLRIHGLSEGNTGAQLLDLVGLPHASLQRYPHEFSGGERQRLAIARALALQPKCLILDESTAALDVSIAAQVLTLLKELQKNLQMAWIFISHDLAIVRQLCHELLVLHQGRVVEKGATSSIFTSPSCEESKRLIQDALFFEISS